MHSATECSYVMLEMCVLEENLKESGVPIFFLLKCTFSYKGKKCESAPAYSCKQHGYVSDFSPLLGHLMHYLFTVLLQMTISPYGQIINSQIQTNNSQIKRLDTAQTDE